MEDTHCHPASVGGHVIRLCQRSCDVTCLIWASTGCCGPGGMGRLLPHSAGVVVESIERAAGTAMLRAHATAPTARYPNAGWCRGVCAAGTRVGSLTRLSAEPRNEKAPRNPRGIATGFARLIRDVLSRADELTDADRKALSPLAGASRGARSGTGACPQPRSCRYAKTTPPRAQPEAPSARHERQLDQSVAMTN